MERRLQLRTWAVSALVLSLAGCTSNVPPPGLIPTGPPVTRLEDVTGEYCYYGPDFNVRSYGRGVEAIPFVPVMDLGMPTLVSVQATVEQIVFRYAGPDGSAKEQVFDVAGSKAEWKGPSLVVEQSLGTVFLPLPMAFHISSRSRESRLFKLKDGRLVMTDTVSGKGYSEAGSASFSGSGVHSVTQPSFHREGRTVAVILDPATGGCEANIEGRPRQPWFNRGPDLRDPACSAQLEEQLAAILADKGEAPEASALASQTLESFYHGSDSGNFLVSSQSGGKYSFEVVKKGSVCVLRLYAKSKGGKSAFNNVTYFAKRPLPACACND